MNRNDTPSPKVYRHVELPPFTKKDEKTTYFLPNKLTINDNEVKLVSDTTAAYNLLGFGGFGAVYCGVYENKKVAIKVTARNAQKNQRFCYAKRETAILEKLQHKCIVRLLGAIEDEYNYYMVLEYCSHGTLRDLISDEKTLRTWSEIQIYGSISEIASGLQFMHHHRYVHHDLKPDNVMLTGHNQCKIVDFGLTLRVTDEGLRRVGGTMKYFAPEMCKTSPHFGLPIDCWALGCILYRLLYIRAPFDHPNKETLQKLILTKKTFYPLYTKQGFDMRENENIRFLTESLLEKNPDARYTASQVLEYIHGIQHSNLSLTFSPIMERYPKSRLMKLVGALQQVTSQAMLSSSSMNTIFGASNTPFFQTIPDDDLPYIRRFLSFSSEQLLFQTNDKQYGLKLSSFSNQVIYLQPMNFFIVKRQKYEYYPDACTYPHQYSRIFTILKSAVNNFGMLEIDDSEIRIGRYTRIDDLDFSTLAWIKRYVFKQTKDAKYFGVIFQKCRAQIDIATDECEQRTYIFNAISWTVRILLHSNDILVASDTFSLDEFVKILSESDKERDHMKICIEIFISLMQQ